MRYFGQYYSTVVTTILFYDFFLTLADEVSHVVGVSFRYTYHTSCERSNMLGRGGNRGVCYVRGTVCRTALVDDLIVFAIFLAVRSPP